MAASEYTPSKSKIALRVKDVSEDGDPRFMLIDHNGHVWVRGYRSNVPEWEYSPASIHVSYRAALATTEADAWLGIPDGYEIVSSETAVMRVWVRFKDKERASAGFNILPDESVSVWEQLDERLPMIVFQTFEGGYQSFDMAEVSQVVVQPPQKVML